MGPMKPFEQVVADHGATVLRVCRALLPPADADDAWSETFLSALAAYPRLDAAASVEGWLVTIARRKAIDQLRARSQQPVPVAELPDGDGRPEPDEAGADLWAAVRALPTRQREAVAYHYLGGLPHTETAAVTGTTAAATRRAAADGIRNLRRTLGGDATTRQEHEA